MDTGPQDRRLVMQVSPAEREAKQAQELDLATTSSRAEHTQRPQDSGELTRFPDGGVGGRGGAREWLRSDPGRRRLEQGMHGVKIRVPTQIFTLVDRARNPVRTEVWRRLSIGDWLGSGDRFSERPRGG